MVALFILNCSVVSLPVQANDSHPSVAASDDKSTAPAQGVAVEPVPDWVRERELPQTTKAALEQAQGGVAYLLSDEQYRSRADGHDDWFRLSTKVTNRSGLESAGEITIAFDPAFETVGVNFIHLIRNGRVIDLTPETRFRVVEREDELGDGIVSGALKILANLRDVRTGDIVDYATTRHARTTLWPRQAFFHFSQRYSDPIALRALRLVWPDGTVPRYKSINSDIAFTMHKSAVGTEWEWIAKDPPVVKAEDDVPAAAFQWGRVDVSTMKNWAELARWATELYRGDESLPDDFAARLDAIAKASPAPADRLTEVTRYIQDNIRYVGEELGEGSYVPRRPKTVLMRGYGDCKDKSLLLALALRRLGIDAVPALVSTSAGERVPDRLPSPLDFDHVIVRAVVDGKILWIDATGAHRGGRGLAIVQSDLGYALPIRDGQAGLERMDGFGDYAGRMTVLERFTVDEAAAVPLTLHVETRYTDARADNMRASWARGSSKKIAESNIEFYQKRFPGIVESKSLVLADDRDRNVLTMTEDYTMSRETFDKAHISAKLTTTAYVLQDMLPDRQSSPRIQPLVVNDHKVNEQTIELHVKNRVLDGLDDVEGKGGAIAFSRRTSKLPDGLSIVYRLDTGAAYSVPAGEAETVYALSDKIKDETGIEFYLEKAPRTAAVPNGIDSVTWDAIRPEIEKSVPLMAKSDQGSKLEALSLLTALSGKVSQPSPAAGLVDGLKGALLSELRRPQAALAALQSATAQYDGNPEVFRIWIAYELDLGTAQSVAKALQRTRAAQPKIVTMLDERWVQAAMQKSQALAPDKRQSVREDICIALSDAGWQQAPRTAFGSQMVGCALAAHSLRGEKAETGAALANEPPVDALLTLAIDRRHQSLWPEIDRIGKDGFRASLERDAARAATAAKATPKDYQAATYQMQTLRALGRFQEALVAGKALAEDKAQLEVVGGDAFWLANEYARNLQALGRHDEAIAAIDGVIALGLDRYPDLVSMAINRGDMLLSAGRYQAVVDAMADLEARHFDRISAYGKMWVWANRACALRALGRDEDARVLDAKLATSPNDNWSAATAAAACRNDTDAVAGMLVTRLRGSDSRPAALGLFITFDGRETLSPFDKKMRQTVANARAKPEVQAEFAKYGRSIHYAGTTQGWSEF